MHSNGPAMLILRKTDTGHPDFSGPDFATARRDLILEVSPDTGPDPVVEAGPELQSAEEMPHPHGMCDKLLEIARQMREGADLNLDLAAQIEELCAEMQGDTPDLKPDQVEGEGEGKELE